jgi:hypothetical protein
MTHRLSLARRKICRNRQHSHQSGKSKGKREAGKKTKKTRFPLQPGPTFRKMAEIEALVRMSLFKPGDEERLV